MIPIKSIEKQLKTNCEKMTDKCVLLSLDDVSNLDEVVLDGGDVDVYVVALFIIEE